MTDAPDSHPSPAHAVPDDFHVFDTTLRDGAQREGINLTVADKLTIARHLDDFGVGFIEGGWPGANPRDTEFFQRAREEIDFRHAQLVAFGATRKAGVRVEDDPQVAALLDSGAPVITLVAKSHTAHVELALRTTPEENLAMIRDTVAHLCAQGRRVFLDCEHFFDGYALDPVYAKAVVRTASEAYADVVVLCDTNGGMLPAQVTAVVRTVLADTGARLGIHAQDDTGCAVANTLAAVDAGATHVQCTANGYGERVGNSNLFPVVAALELKYGRPVLPEGKLAETTRISHAIAEVVNLTPPPTSPTSGSPPSPTRPDCTPPRSRSTRTSTSTSTRRWSATPCGCWSPTWPGGRPSSSRARSSASTSATTASWSAGSSSGSRSASWRATPTRPPTPPSSCCCAPKSRAWPRRYFTVESWRAIVEDRPDGTHANEATVKLWAKGERIVTTAEGNGPVNALDRALRVGLERIYPQLAHMELVDYKVRILEGALGTGSITRVLVSTSDGRGEWSTVGVAENVIAASWQALDDAYVYGLLRAGVEPQE